MSQTTGAWDRIVGQWQQSQGEIRAQWDKLTDDELEQVRGQRDHLIGLIHERYGITRNEASRQVEDWEQRHNL